MLIKVLILSVILTGFAFLALGIKIFFVKKGKFPETSVGHNKEMRKLGLTCPRQEEIICRRKVDDINCCGCHPDLL
jgi:hypothetical protein